MPSCHGEDVQPLKKAPLREAIFELFVDSNAVTQWSPDSETRVFSQLPDYAYHQEELQDFGLMFEVGPDGPIAKPFGPRGRIRRWDERKQRAVQFGPNMCAYNILGAAYSAFENHIDAVAEVVRCYLDEAKPTKIGWVGQRYVNSVSVPDVEVSEYFSIYPKLPGSLSGHRPFALQVQVAEARNATVVVNLSLEKADGGPDATYMLDIYARSVNEAPNDVDALRAWHVSTHQAVRRTFEITISERLRALFQGEP